MRIYLLTFLLFAAFSGIAQTNATWLRYPAISPDGKSIAFGYKGDIYLVPATGGTAISLL